MPTQGGHLPRRDTQKRTPTTQQTGHIGIWSQTSPQYTITEIVLNFRVIGQSNCKGCFPNTRQAIESYGGQVSSLTELLLDSYYILFTTNECFIGQERN